MPLARVRLVRGLTALLAVCVLAAGCAGDSPNPDAANTDDRDARTVTEPAAADVELSTSTPTSTVEEVATSEASESVAPTKPAEPLDPCEALGELEGIQAAYPNVVDTFQGVAADQLAAYEAGQGAEDLVLADQSATYFAFLGYRNSGLLQDHFQNGGGETFAVDPSSLFASQTDLVATLSSEVLTWLQTLPDTIETTERFESRWTDFEATEGDWAFALARFDAGIVASVDVVETNDSSVIVFRHRTTVTDIYDFELGDWRTDHLARLAQHGLADEFRVVGNSTASCEVFADTIALRAATVAIR